MKTLLLTCLLALVWMPQSGILLADEATVTFTNDVLPILTHGGCNSGACHGALAGKGGLKLSLRGYDPEADHFVLTRQAGGRRLDRATPEDSLLLLKPTGLLRHGGGQKLSPDDEDYLLLRRWIAAGAPGPSSTEPRLLRLEVTPSSRQLNPEETFQPQVIATYSDQRQRDVTRWARWESSDENVAVAANGLISGKGYGEAAITVSFGGQVAMIPLVAPYPNPEPQAAEFQRHNFIDDHVNAKLQALRLSPAQPCSEREFIRRVYLDATGTLPTPEAVAEFLADTAGDKRARLIDRLLSSEDHVDYWAHKLADLFLVSSRILPQQAVWAYHQFLRECVAQNVPWNELTRRILTAQGSNLENGAANFFVLHKDTATLAEATSVTFMGMSLACAKCHNHPLEKWTQDDYWKYANLFSQVSLRGGDRPGEVIVKSVPHGDILHQRRGVPMPPTPPGGAEPLSEGDRRAAFAAWLTEAENPYFAKAIINRAWKHYLGRGLIEAEDDLRETNPPSNSALLAALEKDFIEHGYDLRRLQRLILNSAAYQRSGVPSSGAEADDRFYSRFLPKRLPAEVILDAYSQITGVPTNFNEVASGGTGGTMAIGDYPLGTRAIQLPDTKVVSRFLDAFGRPEREVACACERESDATVTQALHLNNGTTLNPKLRDPNARIQQWLNANWDDATAIAQIYELALCRPPTPKEAKELLALLHEAQQAGQPRREQLEDLCWAVLTSREFLFVR